MWPDTGSGGPGLWVVGIYVYPCSALLHCQKHVSSSESRAAFFPLYVYLVLNVCLLSCHTTKRRNMYVLLVLISPGGSRVSDPY